MSDMEQCDLLHSVINYPLTEAFKQLAIVQPNDPVEYLGKYLLRYDENIAKKERLHLVSQEGSIATKRKDPLEEEIAIRNDCDYKERFERTIKREQLEMETDTISMLYDVILSWLIQYTDAEEAYIGKLMVHKDGSSTLRWIASSKKSSSLLINRHTKENECSVTFDACKKLSQESGEHSKDDSASNQFPAFIHIENVLREPKMFFYGIPKIGAYLTRALSYPSHLHADVYNELEPTSPHTKDETVVISVDTMGQARAFSAQNIDTYLSITDLFIERLEKVEHRLYLDEIDQKEAKKVEWKAFFDAMQTGISVNDENIVRDVQGLSEHAKTIKESEMKFAFLTAIFRENTKLLSQVSSWSVPPKSASFSVINSSCVLLGYPFSETNVTAHEKPEWSILAKCFGESQLQCKLEAVSNDEEFLNAKKCSQAASFLYDKENDREITEADLESEQNEAAMFMHRWIVAGLKRRELLSAEIQLEQENNV
ncbi:unnamed protein product [Albugo candida]|uniref:RIIa domain-containing protein n=1 Tax=Albugo candida TaxID=65357 RepID=A0A024GEQ9_9STRA|nr:unnamed protein product [Albugo candida]|eukprot:CCI45256.1 unnamed protein product [Albugo candida]